jgi:uncharacterized protein with FMN-binding domain
MRRILLAVFGALFGTTLLVGLKSQVLGAPAGVVADAPADPAASTNGPPVEPGGTPAASAATTPATPPKPGQTMPAPGSTITQPPTGGTTTTTAPASRTVTGIAVAVKTAQSPTAKSSSCRECHDYTMAVTITVSGGRITSAKVAYNTSPGSSLSYANRAANSLNQKVLTAQTWNLGRVSGATYSGNAYELSLKDAMAKAGLPT